MLTIVIPMGGEARRFAEAGYTFPKPLVEIDRRPMIELVHEVTSPQFSRFSPRRNSMLLILGLSPEFELQFGMPRVFDVT